MKHLFFIFACLLFVVSGCSKSDDAAPLTQSQIIARTWKTQQFDLVVDGKVGPTVYTKGSKTNLTDFDSFQLIFKTDGAFTQTDVDDNGKPIQATGTWKLTNSDKTLELTYSDKTSDTFDIGGLTATELKIGQTTPVKNLTADDLSLLGIIGLQPKISFGTQMILRP
jgi:hypothetical protein